ncbi:IS66 family insertion sequence element accessory protein TnpB [Acidithiobacillus caldus]|uniref:IS66 Orf2 family protein n=1 Tax=Acidithiobacillus caldus (strain SM-1) TaxID=990288 RepID=F9ZLU7_ACICS|nr:IS66 family insertion sequence element accessory protein TnpB [Acidithiobacillus caldus]AEK57429.1 IS66 Orf2 family protein [Acidithiobacillus caldus SM-1]MBU2762682.1 transposase [Acidithiobacillus caldus]MBU2771611.1 transposase [Acidithiobacillus caldus]MBU2782804.1 transposase [Acidithiobacillus caldus]
MLFPEGRIRVFLCRVPVDLRKSFDGLSALVRHTLAQDPFSGHCFVFVNRPGDSDSGVVLGPDGIQPLGQVSGAWALLGRA